MMLSSRRPSNLTDMPHHFIDSPASRFAAAPAVIEFNGHPHRVVLDVAGFILAIGPSGKADYPVSAVVVEPEGLIERVCARGSLAWSLAYGIWRSHTRLVRLANLNVIGKAVG